MNEAETILLKKFGCLDRRQLFEKQSINYTQLDIILSAMHDFKQTGTNTRCCPSCGSQNLATIKRGFYALGVYFPTKNTEKKCLSCNCEFDKRSEYCRSSGVRITKL